jgi:hypothetical protein
LSEETPQEQSSRISKARERQLKRKSGRKSSEKSVAASRRARHLSPSGGFQLPTINMKYIRPIALGGGALLFMAAVIIAVGLFKGGTGEESQIDPNALWVGDEWTYGDKSDEEFSTFVRRLKDNKIGSVYAYVSDLNADNTWTGDASRENRFVEVESSVQTFVATLKDKYPDLQIYGVLGVQAGLDEDGYRLDNTQVQQAVANFSQQVVTTLGCDGVLINVDIVANGDENYLNLLRSVRRAIGEEQLLAIAVPPDWSPADVDIPKPDIIAEGTEWELQYKQRVALLQIDQMAVQSYNSYLTTSDDYTEWVAYQTQAFASALFDIQAPTLILMGAPTYENSPPAHDVRVENMRSSLTGIRQGLLQAGEASQTVSGVAIYANWSTDEVEWTQFKDDWVDSGE